MKKTLEALIAVLELTVENLTLEWDSKYAKDWPRKYDQFIHDLGVDRMRARQILEVVKYEGDEE
jgi:hypothetical protein